MVVSPTNGGVYCLMPEIGEKPQTWVTWPKKRLAITAYVSVSIRK